MNRLQLPMLPPIPLTARFRPKANVLVRELDGEAVLLDLDTGRYFGLNATGVRIWALLDGERALEQLLQEHVVSRERVLQDVRELVAGLRAQGLLVESESTP